MRGNFERTWLERLRAVPLPVVLAECGAVPDRHDPCKWHTATGGLSVNGPKFFDWQRSGGGGGAIDLVMHLRQCGFTEAVEWLQKHAGGQVCADQSVPRSMPALQLPVRDVSRLAQVRRYLQRMRAVPLALIETVVRAGDLWADPRGNAVFLMRAMDGAAVGSELRGTTAQVWRGLAPGSRRDLGYFASPDRAPASVVVCESAIDALSCCVLHPQWRAVSTAGARSDPPWLAPLLRQSEQVYCGFDADETGERMAEEMIARHPSIRRLRPSLHDWNDVLRAHL